MAQTRTGRPGTKVNGNTRTKARSGAANTAGAKPAKEAAGALTGDQGLNNEGHADQAMGSLRKVVVFASAIGVARNPNERR